MELTKESMAIDVASGMTIQQMSDKYKKSVGTIWRRMKTFGIENITYKPFKERREKYIELLKAGESTEGIAKKMGCSYDTAYNYIKTHKLQGYRKKKRIILNMDGEALEKGVLCKAKTSSKTKQRCLYGSKCGNCDSCDYILMTGKRRKYDPDNPEICYSYVYADAETKRRISDAKIHRERDVLIG